MFENLTGRLGGLIKSLRGQARLTEENVHEALREVRIALLEADVALPVVRHFIAGVKEKALGAQVLAHLTPGQAMVGLVYDELTKLMGEHNSPLDLATAPPAVMLVAGLQGTGKTTTCGKLALWISENLKKKTLLASCDVYRPAAIRQLEVLARQIKTDFFAAPEGAGASRIAAAALEYARRHFYEVLLVDTAGRLTVDAEMMAEIKGLNEVLNPIETLLVVDAMQGQDAVNTATAFNNTLPLTGVVLTKLDGDARGGAALSVRHVTGKPIKFVGVGEKLKALEAFHPERMASRVLGMGDVLTLVEEARREVDQKEAEKLAKKMQSGRGFDLEDFKNQVAQMKKMGGLSSLMDKLPAQIGQAMQQAPAAEKEIARIEGIVNSMTRLERAKPEVIKASRKRRIAAGAGVSVQEVNRLLNQFEQAQKMMKMMSKGGMKKLLRGMKGGMPH
ncbi:MAG: signal recognition particle protein [Burkholderiales bacterium]